ncbi:hypothetical protein GE061_001748 [Apolygus lucorum]|uniref:Uncharacterized protein n=1 Tax=Apolygus lucorum TaxID=248454 RepID=A0A6A4JXM3_APOLU|nr:hypothetical protein GE061_001748 [Apolygus lucorum]
MVCSIFEVHQSCSNKAFRSTPINALLAEGGEPPLYLRRKMLLRRDIVRTLADRTHPLHDKYKTWYESSDMVITEGHRQITKVRELLEGMSVYTSDRPLIYTLTTPFSMMSLNIQSEVPGMKHTKAEVSSSQWRAIFREMLVNVYGNHHCIYTDASKNSNGVGVGIYDEDTKQINIKRTSSSLPDPER